ncbi:DUF4326 domain-containing protein [Aquamicrobium sp.]|uniref:DUF4326 domain-containing protein n=1 Tax=Aquamicrobium sp. TaxID=1872579 RepID=UPI00258D1DEE|nr:DUF4326 domain-containing protein [Aquamicrobium sp.]MCK9549164.1 DUF4326 domain-containing protein [Aquamicrobium sp.]
MSDSTTALRVLERTTPKRIQRKRTKGWRMPAGAVCVDRTTKWGNPFIVGEIYGWAEPGRAEIEGPFTPVKDNREAMSLYKAWIKDQPDLIEAAQKELRGKDVACWCGLDESCHADVLLELANK